MSVCSGVFGRDRKKGQSFFNPSFGNVRCEWSIRVPSIFCSYFGSNTCDNTPTTFVSWIVLVFVRLREVSVLVEGPKRLIGPRRVESWQTGFNRSRLTCQGLC